jgi:hypothetical protein
MISTRRFLRHAVVLDELGGDRVGAADRQALVVLRRAGRVGVAVHLDPGRLHRRRRGGRLSDDLARALGERRLVPVEEHQEAARLLLRNDRSRPDHGRRRFGRVEGVTDADQDLVAEELVEHPNDTRVSVRDSIEFIPAARTPT